MLAQRIITASILATLIISSVIFLPSLPFSFVMAIVILLGAWEWTHLINLNNLPLRIAFLVSLAVPIVGIAMWTQFLEVIALAFEWPAVREYSGILEWLVIPPVLFWITMMILIRQLPATLLKIQLKQSYQALTGWFILLMAWMFLSRLRSLYGTDMVLYFMILIWSADISAYFAGKKYGKDKLSSEISPGKTVQGVYGALASAAVCGLILGLIFQFSWMSIIDFILLSVLTTLISVYGDLFFSLVKRQRGVKDSGFIVPGHGGVLDRIDSMIAAAPFFYAGIVLIGFGVFA
ncbi:MAG: phosphatidate cytidylyltransferase [Methylococcales bacterium]|nr:phosphatidate cytidylyltransferase [Methylococcales bacterium]